MSIVNYSIIGGAACLAAIGGAYANIVVQAGAGAGDTVVAEEHEVSKITTPQIPVPIYSKTTRLGYCVIRAATVANAEHGSSDDAEVARITNKLFVEFSKETGPDTDGPTMCAARDGMEIDDFKIVQSKFYEDIR